MSADSIYSGLQSLEAVGRAIPLRLSFARLKSFAFRTKKMAALDKLCTCIEIANKKRAIKTWKKAVDLWQKKVQSIKKLLHKSKMRITSKVLNKWYTQFRHEESVYHSVSHRDYIISMYEILGNTQTMKQFSSKCHSVFSFMLNRYMQRVNTDNRLSLKKIVVAFKKDSSTFYALDFTEEDKPKANHRFISPIKNNRKLPDVVNALLSSKHKCNRIDMSSPSHSGNITPIRDKILIEDHDFLNSASPQNYSFLINTNKGSVKSKFIMKIDAN